MIEEGRIELEVLMQIYNLTAKDPQVNSIELLKRIAEMIHIPNLVKLSQ